MKRSALLAVVVAVLAAAAWMGLRGPGGPDATGVSDRAAPDVSPPPPVGLEGAPPRAPAAEPARPQPSAEEEPPAGPATDAVPQVEGLSIEGTVLGPDGRGVPDVEVHASLPVAVGAKSLRFPPDSVSSGRTDADGRYRILGLPPGRYDLRLEGADAFPPIDPVSAEAGARADFRLRRGVSVSVRVRDERGAPVPGAQVSTAPMAMTLDVLLGGASVRAAVTNADGVGTIAGLAAQERYLLRAQAQGFAAQAVEEWSPADTTFTLARLEKTTTRGIVRDSEGRPLRDVAVHATYQGDLRLAVTREDGTFSFEDPPGLEGRIVALHPYEPVDAGLRSRGVPFPAGTADLVLVLARGADLSVRLDMPAGWEPGREAHATLYREPSDGQGGERRVAIPRDGRIRFGGLDPRSGYLLWVHDPESGRYARVAELRATGGEIPVRLTTGLAISGRCAVPPESMLASVSARGLGVDAWGALLPDGRYEIRGLPPGDWDVRAFVVSRGMAQWNAEVLGVPAGGTADLELKPAP